MARLFEPSQGRKPQQGKKPNFALRRAAAIGLSLAAIGGSYAGRNAPAQLLNRIHGQRAVEHVQNVSPRQQVESLLEQQRQLQSDAESRYSSDFQRIYDHYNLTAEQQQVLKDFSHEQGVPLVKLIETYKNNNLSANAIKENLDNAQTKEIANPEARIAYVLAATKSEDEKKAMLLGQAAEKIRRTALQNGEGPGSGLPEQLQDKMSGESPESFEKTRQAQQNWNLIVTKKLQSMVTIQKQPDGSYALRQKSLFDFLNGPQAQASIDGKTYASLPRKSARG